MAEFSKGQGYSKADLCSSGIPAFLYGQMYTDYKLLITESGKYLPQNSDGVFSTAGDVIIPASGESPEEIAIASVIGKTGILLGGDLNIIRPEKSTLDSIFLALSASGGRLHDSLVSRAQGKTIVHLHNSDIAASQIRFPTLPEQRRIGGFFSTLDSLIAAAERQEALLRQKKQAYLQLMFPREGESEPRLRFAGFSGEWQQRPLRDVAEKTGSGGTPISSNPRYYGGSIPFLGIGDINGRYVDTTQKTLTEEGLANSAAWIVPEGSISLAMYASYGKSAILARPMATSQAFFNIVFRSNVTRDFVYSRLQCAESRHEWDVLVSTGTQPNLSGNKLRKWMAGYPSLLEQRRIGEFFSTLDNLIDAAEKRTKSLQALKSAYLQRMFV